MLIDSFINFINKIKPNYTPDTILDVGSRDLEQSIEFTTVYPEARIIAFEPNPNMSKYIASLIIDTPYHNIEFWRYALGKEEGLLNLHLPPQNENFGAASLLKPIQGSQIVQNYSTVPVRVRPFRDVALDYHIDKVDILWMDVQGFELEVMEGMGKFLDTVDFIHMEATQQAYYEGQPVVSQAQAYLQSKGFTIGEFSTPNYHPYGEGDLFAYKIND